MIKIKALYIFLFSVVLSSTSNGQADPEEKGLQAITTYAIKAQTGFLASGWTEGRMAGEKGELIASDYIASILQLYGVQPGGDIKGINNESSGLPTERSYFQDFSILKTVPGDRQSILIRSDDKNLPVSAEFYNGEEIQMLSKNPFTEIEAQVVFAGYGFRNEKLGFDDFRNINIKGKFLLMITGVPAFARNELSLSELQLSEKESDSYAREYGAIGILEFDPDTDPNNDIFKNEEGIISNPVSQISDQTQQAIYSVPGRTPSVGFIRMRISSRVAIEILNGTGIDLKKYITYTGQNKIFNSPDFKEKSIKIISNTVTYQVPVRNVVGVIEGNKTDEIIVVGAHYDHLGSSQGYIWYGADDNASGTVGAMTVAKAIMAAGKKPEKTILIALWTAEEEGLMGSRHFVKNTGYPDSKIILNINFDMISRYIAEDNKDGVVMTYSSSCPFLKDITETNLNKYNVNLKVDFQPSEAPPGGSDHRSFIEAGIPVMRFKPGHREEYHTPSDRLETLDWDIMERIIKISFLNTWTLANSSWQ